jgi:hypothetical protein
MCEILFLIFLTRKLGEILKAKGRKSGWFKFLLVVMWFAGEIGGLIVGTIFVTAVSGGNEDVGLLAYVFALLGAGGGATLTFVIASSLSPVTHRYDYEEDEFAQQPRRRRIEDEDLMGPYAPRPQHESDLDEPLRPPQPPEDHFRE